MRLGNNPNKGKQAGAKLERVVFQVLTYLPNLEGYHSRRMDVIKMCLRSMIQGANMPYSLVIWDSGSIPELLEWIQDEIKPDMLINSLNFGKNASRKMMAQMIPADSILCYADDDMYFYPNWLAPQMDLLQNFPNVSSVTGYPVRTSFRWGNENTLKWADRNATTERGRFIPDEWERDFSLSIGRDPIEHAFGTKADIDTRIIYKGMSAYATSHHCQQIGYARVMSKALQFDGQILG